MKFLIIFIGVFFGLNLGYAEEIVKNRGKIESKSNLKSALNNVTNAFDYVNLTTSLSQLEGMATETVYDSSTGKKISDLEWDIHDLQMLGLAIDLGMTKYFNFGLSYAHNINNGGGNMIDTDWLYTDRRPYNDDNWTDKSWSRVTIRSASDFDLNFGMQNKFASVNEKFWIRPKAMLGYKQLYFRWEDMGMNYTYSSNPNNSAGFRNQNGSFGGRHGINYWQEFIIPYIGTGYDVSLWNGRIKQGFTLKYSTIASGRDKDFHIMRNEFFWDEFNNLKYTNVVVDLSVKLVDSLYLGGGYEFSKIHNKRGDAIDKLNGVEYADPGGAGISNRYQKSFMYLRYEM